MKSQMGVVGNALGLRMKPSALDEVMRGRLMLVICDLLFVGHSGPHRPRRSVTHTYTEGAQHSEGTTADSQC